MKQDHYPEPIDTDLTPDELAKTLFQATPPKDWEQFAADADKASDSSDLNDSES